MSTSSTRKKTVNIDNKINARYAKYDKNNDNFVSIAEYLDANKSLGPKAYQGKLNYHYQDFHNFMNYFMWMIDNDPKIKILCIPDSTIRFKGHYYRGAMVVSYDDKLTIVPQTIKKGIFDCLQSETRFVIMSLMVFNTTRDGFGHQNILLFDRKLKTIERFEPHGHHSWFSGEDTEKIKRISNHVNQTVVKMVLKYLPRYSYILPEMISPPNGIQCKSDSYNGMCITWCMIYLHLRILNPRMPSQQLYQKILRRPAKDLTAMCLRYARRVERVLKRENLEYHKYFVLK